MRLSRPIALLALVAAGRPTAAAAAEAPAADPQVGFEKLTLPNGLEVILAPDPRVPLVAVNVWYHVGSGNETPGKSGFAHLFEHMMFQGSKHVGEDSHFSVLKEIGVDATNGTTNSDRTNYFEVVPSNQLETALWMESDRMGWLLDLVGETSLANQIEVVRNERRQRYDNSPYGKALFAQSEALYPEGHPYRHLTIGKHEDLAAASLADVKGFFKTWYVPANATLAIVGDFEMAEGKRLVEKWFGTLPRSARPALVKVPPPTISSREVTVTDDALARLPQIVFSWHSPAMFADGDAELSIVARALSREGPGRLYRALIYDRPLAQSVRANQSGGGFSGVFEISVTLRPETKIEDVKRIVLDEVARLGREPLAEREIQQVIVGREANSVRRLETVNGRAQMLQQYNHYLGDPGKLTWDLDRFRHTSAERIRDTVARVLTPDHVLTVITVPQAHAKRGQP